MLNSTCPPSFRLVEEAVSNGTVWSPLPCPPLPSHPRELTLSDTEQPSLSMVHVFTVSVTTPTTTRVITSSPSYCDPPSHSLNLSSPISLSLGHPLPSPSPFYLLPVVPFSPPLLSHPVGDTSYYGCSGICGRALIALCVGEAEDKAATSLLFTCHQIHKKHTQ